MPTRIERCREFTTQKINEIASVIKPFADSDWALIANGSYARREATPYSDLDYYLLYTKKLSPRAVRGLQKKLRKAVGEVIGKAPSEDGAFDATIPSGSLKDDIGGPDDTNERITRRVLFLTEGTAVHNPRLYRKEREALVGRYVNDEISDHQLCLFLLNDLIRYYRTICVDYEHKVEAGKAWGIRNIKLVFSRKLLYFSGLLIVAETAQRTPSEKREIIHRLTEIPPIERIAQVCGASADLALASYDVFLKALDDAETRKLLETIKAADRKRHEQFRRLKNEGQHFSEHLASALRTTYSISHPIHRSIIL
jgi:predicted nucleotidyltransferase